MFTLYVSVSLYLFAVLILFWRYSVICNTLRKKVLVTSGRKTTFAQFIPQILRDSFLFPFSILWNGLEAWLKELEN